MELVSGHRGGVVQADQARCAQVARAVLAGESPPRAGAAAGVSRDTARRYWHHQAMESAATASEMHVSDSRERRSQIVDWTAGWRTERFVWSDFGELNALSHRILTLFPPAAAHLWRPVADLWK